MVEHFRLLREENRLVADPVTRNNLSYLLNQLEEALQARTAALEAQLAARTGGMKPLDEDDYEEVISAAAINMRKATSGIRGQMITVIDCLDWWVMKETERRILSALSPAPEAQQERPAEQVVTEAMVEAALKAWRNYATSGPVADDWSDAMRVALKAAMEARDE